MQPAKLRWETEKRREIKQRHSQIRQVSVASLFFFLPLHRDEKQAQAENQSQQTCQHLQTEGDAQCLSACACAHVLGKMPRRRGRKKKIYIWSRWAPCALSACCRGWVTLYKVGQIWRNDRGLQDGNRAISVHNVLMRVACKIFAPLLSSLGLWRRAAHTGIDCLWLKDFYVFFFYDGKKKTFVWSHLWRVAWKLDKQILSRFANWDNCVAAKCSRDSLETLSCLRIKLATIIR